MRACDDETDSSLEMGRTSYLASHLKLNLLSTSSQLEIVRLWRGDEQFML